jgi:hypothetical protein
MNAGSAPERISEAHLTDQPPDFARHLRPATSPSGLPSPAGPKTGTVPAEDSFGLNDRECIENAWCDPIEQHEDQPIAYLERSPFRCASTQHIELLAQGQQLRLERGSRSEQIEERRGDQANEVAHPAFIARFGASRQADGISDRDTGRRGDVRRSTFS